MASAKAAAPAAPAPAPAPQQGTQGPRHALAPTLVNMPPNAPNPVKEANERQKVAMAKLQEKGERKQVEDAEESATPPKAKATESGESSPSKPKTPPVASTESTKEKPAKAETAKPNTAASETKTATEPEPSADAPKEDKYTVKAFRKWAEEHPERAAEIFKVAFKGAKEGDATEWIRLTNKTRKKMKELEARETAIMTKAEAKHAETLALHEKVDGSSKTLAPIADLWFAVKDSAVKKADGTFDLSKLDFDAAEAAFKENTGGVALDDFMRARARKGIVNPEVARLKAENARLLKAQPEPAKAEEKPPEPKPEPKAEPAKVDWGAEIPKAHGLRKIANWEKLLDAEMALFHDDKLDEYNADPEEQADKVLKRELAALAGEDEAEKPKPKPKAEKEDDGEPAFREGPKPKGGLLPARTTPKAKLSEDESDVAPKGFAAREAWAMERARARARGEMVG